MIILLFIAVICIPLMLIVRPLYENSKHKKEEHHKVDVEQELLE